MGIISGIIKRLLKWSLYLVLFVTVVTLIPNLPPYTKFSKIEQAPTIPRVGTLAPNKLLNNPEKLYKGKVLGPEAFELYKGELYTSLLSGEVVKISPGGHVTFVTKVGQPCTGFGQEAICGRPLGLQIDEKTNQLYVADAYHGVWKVDLRTDKKQLLLSPRVEVDGALPKILNGLVLDNKGDLYVTHSSTDFDLHNGAYTSFVDPTGRVLHYDAAKNKSTVILDNLWFANGITISPDNQFILVGESFRHRIIKKYISGPQKGKTEVFIDGLPGIPDNIRALPDGSGVLVANFIVFDANNPLLTYSLSSIPVIRKFVARLTRIIELSFEFLNSQYPHPVLEDIVHFIGHFRSTSGFSTGISGLFQIDWNGNIVASYYTDDGSHSSVSDAFVYNDKLYIGSPLLQDYIAAVPVPPLLKKAFTKTYQMPAEKVKVEKKSSPKPVESNDKVKVVNIDTAKIKEVVQEKPEKNPNVETKTAPPQKPIEKPQPKPAEKPQPKPTEKPQHKPTEKPSTKPTEKPQPKPTEKPQYKPTEKPSTKPTEKPQLKPTEKPQTKPTEKPQTKPTEKPQLKPSEKIQPKPTEKPQPKSAEIPQPQQEVPVPKPTEKSQPKSSEKVISQGEKPPTETKPIENKIKEVPKHTEPKVDTKPPAGKQSTKTESKSKRKETEQEKPKKISEQQEDKSTPETIPIEEEIPSDTRKPNKETLKVIKRGGPAEIPNPNL